jgi:hypothetical protein
MSETKQHKAKLVFVYNADSGLFNTLGNIGHKIFSPETYNCPLCDLTHGYFSMRGEWRSFIKQLDYDLEFLHRDEFIKRYPQQSHTLYPVIFIKVNNIMTELVDSNTLQLCKDIEQLKTIIQETLKQHHL